jgi:hypothetical protein
MRVIVFIENVLADLATWVSNVAAPEEFLKEDSAASKQ